MSKGYNREDDYVHELLGSYDEEDEEAVEPEE
jgi:hypothetical protein